MSPASDGFREFMEGTLFASPVDALVADGQRIVGTPVELALESLPPLRVGQEMTLGFAVGIDILVRVESVEEGTRQKAHGVVIAVVATPEPPEEDE